MWEEVTLLSKQKAEDIMLLWTSTYPFLVRVILAKIKLYWVSVCSYLL